MKSSQERADTGTGKAPQPYLDGDFAKELSYQLWVTKGARFHACRRLQTKQKWSSYSIAALAFYAITVNLVPVYGVAFSPDTGPLFAFVSSALSVLIIIISLLEGARQYDLRADRHHRCGLELGKIYRELRQLRTAHGDEPQPLPAETIQLLRERYEAILDKHENHEDVDFLLMQAKKSEWFNKGFAMRVWVRVRWYLQVSLFYHLTILVPPVVLIWWWASSATTGAS